MTGKNHIKTSVPISLLSLSVIGMITVTNFGHTFGVLLFSLIGALAPDIDTYKSLAFWKNPFFKIMRFLVLFLIKASIVLFLVAGSLSFFYEQLPYRKEFFIFAFAFMAIFVFEKKFPLVTYYVIPLILLGLLVLNGAPIYQAMGLIGIIIIISGHRKVTHSLDFLLLLSLVLLLLPKTSVYMYLAFLIGYAIHLLMDLFTGRLVVSFILPLISFGNIRKRYISLKLTDYDSKTADLMAYSLFFVTAGTYFYLYFL